MMDRRVDDIIGHKYLYSNGVLHRDVSPGNILIEWHPGSEANKPSISGRLIDLDRGKRGKSFSSSRATAALADDDDSDDSDSDDDVSDYRGKSFPSPSQPKAVADEDVNAVRYASAAINSWRLETDVARQALEFLHERNSATNYITAAVEHALKFKHLTEGNICTLHNLQWKQVRP
jgi:serine/threonine protein kinase